MWFFFLMTINGLNAALSEGAWLAPPDAAIPSTQGLPAGLPRARWASCLCRGRGDASQFILLFENYLETDLECADTQ